ncbi:polyprenyl synthetase family protein [Fulvivirgaceae bacterium BMA12]|uniref:Polyprenyl synthetase family protein n=1 Tax=Agaribacillus aureus TaxID=3051825 RepID=A0ABT8L9Y3_9BACT|nr:polyprenyl synthetase family protein [Fulvivirgaceae bacterium BMA12]
MNKDILNLVEAINKEIAQFNFGDSPKELYEPIRYIMDLGGKRMRPLLVALSYQLFNENVHKVMKPAIAVEVFHNFTLMHDDIMDHAPLRRGQPTVHTRWNDNIAILSGDVMMVRAYELFLEVEDSQFKTVISKFNKCATEVCEGQQLDMNFETQEVVTVPEYLEMIRLKTAVLLGFSVELGAILAGASDEDQRLMSAFGTNIGLGFQLKDDLLDVYADQAKFGKQPGGDIIANKKTFLLIKALENAGGAIKNELNSWLQRREFDKEEKVSAVKGIYDQLGIKDLAENKMNEYFQMGFEALEHLNVDPGRKEKLMAFTKYLVNREK